MNASKAAWKIIGGIATIAYVLAIAGMVSWSTSATAAPSVVWADGRDPWSLWPRKLVDRDLSAQLSLDAQSFRMGPELPWLALAADFRSATVVPVGSSYDPGRFHGFFVLDTFGAVTPFDGVELSLNLTIFHPSASEGWRRFANVRPGAALHMQKELFTIFEAPLVLDVLALDLDLYTLGAGLLVEELPAEGFVTGLSYDGIDLRAQFIGKVFWLDNLGAITLSAFDGLVGAALATWFSDAALFDVGAAELPDDETKDIHAVDFVSTYLTAFGRMPVTETLGLTAELGARLADPKPRFGVLLRADWRSWLTWDIETHVGYQFRYYQADFGPRQSLEGPTTGPLLPFRENTYLTNSFQYFGYSRFYDQWSHTLMAELRGRPFGHFGFFLGAEVFALSVSSPRVGTPALDHPIVGVVPGSGLQLRARAAAELYPWRDQPHRVSFWLTNKTIDSLQDPTAPGPGLYRDLVVLQIGVEAYL